VTLFGTGIRGTGNVQASCTINGAAVPVLYAGSQMQFQGLDQVNISLPPSLAGSGLSTLQLTINGQAANPVTLTIQ
jgi:uncharacterized protein (TIGR03437 family)